MSSIFKTSITVTQKGDFGNKCYLRQREERGKRERERRQGERENEFQMCQVTIILPPVYT